MSRRGSILIVHQIPSGMKRAGYAPYTREGAIPSPCNCKTLAVMEGQEAIAGLV